MQTTYKKFSDCLHAGSAYVAMQNNKENKLTYALRKFSKNHATLIDNYTSKVKDLEIDYASIDEKKNLIVVGTGFAYTKENQKLFNDAVRKLNVELVEVEPFLVKEVDVPKEVPITLLEAFEGFVVPDKFEYPIEAPVLKANG